jgi:hypothetical protein
VLLQGIGRGNASSHCISYSPFVVRGRLIILIVSTMITRGGKVAAEKCGREIESGLDMGSPDRRESIPSPDDNQVNP